MSQPPRSVIDAVDKRDEWSCVRCGVSLYATHGSRHHRKLRSQGGKHASDNLVLLCGSGTTGCHGWAHAHPVAARHAGLIVSAYADPVMQPVQYPDGAWWLLASDGTRTRVRGGDDGID